MKSLVLTAVCAFLLVNTAFAELNFKIKSLWYSTSNVEGITGYMAVVEDKDHYYSGDKVLIFGNNENGKTIVQYFTMFGINFYTNSGSKFKGMSDTTYLSGTVLLKNKLVKVKLTKGSKTTSLNFKKSHSEDLMGFARKSVALAKLKLNYFDRLESINNLTHLKRKLLRLKDLMGYILEDDLDYGVITHDLQVEQEWNATPANSTLASAHIVQGGQDPISRRFRVADRWTDEDSLPDYRQSPVSYFSKNPGGFTTDLFLQGAEKYVRYEIVNIRYLSCGRKKEKVKDFTWILKDGSTFSYSPFIECD